MQVREEAGVGMRASQILEIKGLQGLIRTVIIHVLFVAGAKMRSVITSAPSNFNTATHTHTHTHMLF